MLDLVTVTEHIKRMNTLGIEEMGKLRAVIGLNGFGSITEKDDGTLDKIDRGEAAVFFIRIDKSLSRGLLDDRVLVEPLVIFTCITDFGNEFHIHLPLDANHSGSVVGFIVQGLFLGGFNLFAETKTDEYAIERAGMTGIRLILSQLAVKLTQGYVGIPSVVVLDPLQFLLSMGVGMRRMGTMRFGYKGLLGSVIPLIPSHQRGF